MGDNFEKAKRALMLAVTKAFHNQALMNVTQSGFEVIEFKNRIQFDFSNPVNSSIVMFFMDDLKTRIFENVYGKGDADISDAEKDEYMKEMLKDIFKNFLDNYFEGYGFDQENFYPLEKEHSSCYIINGYFNEEGIKLKITVFLEKFNGLESGIKNALNILEDKNKTGDSYEFAGL